MHVMLLPSALHEDCQEKDYLVVYPPTRLLKAAAMKRQEVKSCRPWLLYLQ